MCIRDRVSTQSTWGIDFKFKMDPAGRGCGGFSSAKPADDYVVEITNNIRKDVEAKLGRTATEFTPTIARKGAAGGTMMYLIKINLGGGEYAHATVQLNLDDTQTLLNVVGKQTESSPLEG
eukprot:TRINITY_DN2833_c0_g1_i1.p1 TRINITY_DN2833_c0_g1~~TRINITY_DN2833_c0_g1_i1.p1  ORF type:complete len:121 (-),score=38.44 TRINITY_DN2833_c0_g1_i1:144-506(-)